MRNILFITIDQWRADALGCAGNTTIATPHLDSLARDGMCFTRHYANASPCGPSRAVLFSGMYQHNNGVVLNGSPLSAKFTNLALESRKAGYDPTLFGYTDTTLDPRVHAPEDPALKTYESVLPGFTAQLLLPSTPLAWLVYLQQQGYDFGVDVDAVYRPACQTPGRGPTYDPARFRAEHGISAYLTDQLLDFIAIRPAQPWFVHAAYIRPHPPFVAPEPYNSRFSPKAMAPPRRAPTPGQEAAQHPLLRHYLDSQRQSDYFVTGEGKVKDLSDDAVAQLRATYYGMVSEVDDQIGRLVAQLKQWNLYQETLIVVTSDHGEMLGDHFMLGKNGYFDEAFHVPLIVRDPLPAADATRGRQFDGFSEAVDVMPTVLEWIGVASPRQCDGRSLLEACRGRTPADWRREAHWEFDFRDGLNRGAESALGLAMDACALASIRDTDYQYVHFSDLPPLFFDLHDDPHCLNDRTTDPALAATMLDYAQRMLSWRMASNSREMTAMIAGPQGIITRG